jgi:uncharacterized damage-inducible protein DinB
VLRAALPEPVAPTCPNPVPDQASTKTCFHVIDIDAATGDHLATDGQRLSAPWTACNHPPMAQNFDEADRSALLTALEYQRASVRSIVDGLSEQHWHTSVVPSGWTPAGLVTHLGGAERHWISVILDDDPGHRFDEDFGDEPYDPSAPFVIDWPSDKVLAYYRHQTQHADDVLTTTALDSQPRGRHGTSDTDQPRSVREIVLHLIEETAAHSGHLEIARELLDGQTRLGLR